VFICFARLTHLTFAQKIIYPLLPASEVLPTMFTNIYNILLPRNYKAWSQSSSAVEASLEHTKWRHQPYFEEEAPTYSCYFGQILRAASYFKG
jgi:hypothetical protein